MLSSTDTKLKDKSLFKQKKSKRGRKVPGKDNKYPRASSVDQP
jgi:hypothetical protein